MSQRKPYAPFVDLKDFPDLKSLITHIINSVKVDSIKIRLPLNFNRELLNDPDTILSIPNIPFGENDIPDMLIGNTSFSDIRYKANNIIIHVNERIKKITENTSLSFDDKLQLYNEIKNGIKRVYREFNTRNPIRYMAGYKWIIIVAEFEEGKPIDKEIPFASSKIDMQPKHWNFLENSFAIRGYLLYEILCLIKIEITSLKEELRDNKYELTGDDTSFKLCELALAILATDKVDFVNGDEKTFVHDFLSFFGKTDKDFANTRGKVLKRVKRPKFLEELEESLINYQKKSIDKKPL